MIVLKPTFVFWWQIYRKTKLSLIRCDKTHSTECIGQVVLHSIPISMQLQVRQGHCQQYVEFHWKVIFFSKFSILFCHIYLVNWMIFKNKCVGFISRYVSFYFLDKIFYYGLLGMCGVFRKFRGQPISDNVLRLLGNII